MFDPSYALFNYPYLIHLHPDESSEHDGTTRTWRRLQMLDHRPYQRRPVTESSVPLPLLPGAKHHEYVLRVAMYELQGNNDLGTHHTRAGL
jgi:hypothetical protein